MLAHLVAARSPWAPVHVSSSGFHGVCTRQAAAHAPRRHGGGGGVAAAAGGGGGRPAKTTGRRRGKALLQDVALKPGEQGDELLEQITRDLKNGIEATNMVQWYPGHIAKAERDLKDQLKAVDIVLEVRDGRIPMSTRHPHIPQWIGSKPRVLLINRKDMVPEADRAAWSRFFAERGHSVQWTNGNLGDGVTRVMEQAAAVGRKLNEKRLARGLRPRPVRAVVIGFPNVGKSALINRLLGRRMVDSAPKPGVTRQLRWVRIGGDIDMLDAPGIIPMSFKDQVAAQRLAMCNDIGEASYVDSLVAAAFLETARRLPSAPAIMQRLRERYKLDLGDYHGEEYVHALGDRMFNEEPERAGQRILKDFRGLTLGRICLELPDQFAAVREELPRLLQSLVSPTSAERQEALVRRQFAVHSRPSHPFGYAVGSAQIACMLTCMYLWRSILFPTVEILPICVLFDRERLTAALNVEGALRLRWLGLRVPLLAQFVIELAPRRERGAAPGTLCITYWDEHYSLRSLAVMLPGPLAWLVDWWCRRAVGVASERLLRLLTRMGMAPWSQLRQE